MKIFRSQSVDVEYLEMVESMLTSFGDTDEMLINYITCDTLSQSSIDVWQLLIEREKLTMNRRFAIENLDNSIAALEPYVDLLVVEAAFWYAGKLYILYIDPAKKLVIHESSIQSESPPI